MFPRLIFPVIFAFISLNLLSQAKIVSITYDGDVATLSRNTPQAGIVYYWQGTSCGTLMNHSSATTLATTDGTYFLRGYNSSGAVWATTCASTTVTFPDLTPPLLSGVTTGPIDEGDPIAATSNENGMIYLVLEGTAANLTSINSDKVSEAVATAHTPVSLSTTGIGLGLFKVFAVDAHDNISLASDFIEVTDLTAPVLSDVSSGPVDVGDDIAATSNENGVIYLVPEGTAGNVGAVNAAKVSEAAASAGTPVILSTSGISLGSYIVYAMDGFDNFSSASPVIEVLDMTAPVLSDVTAGPVEIGTEILATSNEDGMIYLVPGGTAAGIGDITSASASQAVSSANVASTLATVGIDLGEYIVYAVDGSDNISAASPAITLTWATFIDPGTANSDQVQIYPVNVVDVLYIKSREQVSEASVYSLQGAQLIRINTPIDQIEMSHLNTGVYIVNLKLEDGTGFSARITKE
jgi:hypothetical protein